jgi:hypothetical protein
MIWELAQDHSGGQPGPLFQAVKQALATPGFTNLQSSNNNASLSFNGIALGSYRVQWSSNLTAGTWNTLLITNVSNTGGVLQVTDPGAITNRSPRFYRVQTPP